MNMAKRKGAGKGTGRGYKNLRNFPKDPKVHSDSARGRKQPQRIKIPITRMSKREKLWKWIDSNIGTIDTFDIISEDNNSIEIDVYDLNGKTEKYYVVKDDLKR